MLNYCAAQNAVTYLPSNTRFGDQLSIYFHAKWISWKYNIPLLYTPFLYSSDLLIDTNEIRSTKKKEQQYGAFKELRTDKDLSLVKNESNTLFYVKFKSRFSSCRYDLFYNESFKTVLRNGVRPKAELKKIAIPPSNISVALHVRKGGGFDEPLFSRQRYDAQQLLQTKEVHPSPDEKKRSFNDIQYPRKCPPNQYYIDQVIRLSEMLNDAPLYVHIFTDEPNPMAILTEFDRAINKPNITFGCRTDYNHHDSNVLTDFFAMLDFDCLIRSSSHFSENAEIIGNFQIVLSPKKAVWIDNCIVVTEVECKDKRNGTWTVKTLTY